jgi:hypothetical protein
MKVHSKLKDGVHVSEWQGVRGPGHRVNGFKFSAFSSAVSQRPNPIEVNRKMGSTSTNGVRSARTHCAFFVLVRSLWRFGGIVCMDSARRLCISPFGPSTFQPRQHWRRKEGGLCACGEEVHAAYESVHEEAVHS